MAVLTPPSTPGLRASRWGLRANTYAFVSPFNRSSQTFEQVGAIWYGQFTLPPMNRVLAAPWQAFFVNLDGRNGRFYIGDPDAKTPQGTWAGTPITLGEDSAGSISIFVGGFDAGATGKAGDYFQIGDELKMVIEDFTANGSGQATVNFKPMLYSAYGSSTALDSSAPVCIMRLLDDEQAVWDADMISVYGMSFAAEESRYLGAAIEAPE